MSIVRLKCANANCNNLAAYKGKTKGRIRTFRKLCFSCHYRKYKMPMHNNKTNRFVAEKCSSCSWIGPCDRHRRIAGGKYTRANVVILCPNCHRLVHCGKILIK